MYVYVILSASLIHSRTKLIDINPYQMKSYQLIHQLLTLVEIFENDNNQSEELTIQNFTGFLNTHLAAQDMNKSSNDIRFGKNEDKAQKIAYQLDNNISRLFVYMSRYAKSYIKKALSDTPLQTAEDFTCLAILLTHDDLSKSELINRNLLEKTSGTEVIKRLLNKGLVKQSDDQEDKRGKRISITDQGKELLYIVFSDMNHVGKIITGELTFSEKLTLQYLLQKLEDFHYQIYEEKSINNKVELKAWAKEIK